MFPKRTPPPSTASRRRSKARRELSKSLRSTYRHIRIEQLEDRRLLTVGTPVLGISNDVVFNGDSANDRISFSVSSEVGREGLLQHSRGGSFGFVSNFDLDSVTAGEQTRLVSQITSFRYDDAGENDRLFFGGANPFMWGDASVDALAGEITIGPGTSIETMLGSITLVAKSHLLLQTASAVTTKDGGITLSANPNGTAVGDFAGLEAEGATIRTTGSGLIELRGKGGDDVTDSLHHGVYLHSGTIVESTSDQAVGGTITIDGAGGDGTNSNRGVVLSGTGTSVKSVFGNIDIIGVGGHRPGSNSGGGHGVSIESIDTINSSGTGENAATITINGTGGAGSNSNYGVNLSGAATVIASVDGDIRIVGQGGGNGVSQYNYGVYGTNTGTIRSAGVDANAATITIIGDGGIGTSLNAGIVIGGAESGIFSGYGDISITGRGGSGTGDGNFGGSVGMAIESSGTGETAAKIDIHGTGGMNSSGYGISVFGSVTTEDGDVSITGLATGDGTRNGDTGAQVYAAIVAEGVAGITVDGRGGQGITSSGVGIGTGANLTANGGEITITGQAGDRGTGVSIKNIQGMESKWISDGTLPSPAKITIDGTGGTGGGYGVSLSGASEGITSVDGAITITGRAGDGIGGNLGVHLNDFGAISSTGTTAQAATITIHGEGSAGAGRTSHDGVIIDNTNINSFVGNISITGTGGSGDMEYSQSSSRGLVLINVEIASKGTSENATGSPAAITLNGTGGEARRQNYGTYLSQSAVMSVMGAIDIRGEGGGNGIGDTGVRVESTELTSTGEGSQAATISLSSESGVFASGTLSTIDGDAAFTGLSGSSVSGSGTITSTGDGTITFDGGDVLVGGTITSEFGDIVLGGASVHQTNGLIQSTGIGLDAAQLLIGGDSTHSIRLSGDLTSFNGDIQIVNQITDASTGLGYISIYGDITSTGTDKVYAAKITIDGTGTDRQSGVTFDGSNQVVSSNVGDISITGRGGESNGGGSRGVALGRASILSTGTDDDAAQILIHGTGGAGVNGNTGVYFEGRNVGEISSVFGAISITGVGGSGTGSSNAGVYVRDASIRSTGTTTTASALRAATITINGTGGGGTSGNDGVRLESDGVRLESNAAIYSVDGAVSINGSGGVGYGVLLNPSSSITSSGVGTDAATITIEGTAGASEYLKGVVLNRPDITSIDGDITISGYGSVGQTQGIYVDGAQVSSTGTGIDAAAISLLGIGGDGGYSQGIEVRRATTSFTTVDGDLTILGQGGTDSGSIGLYVLDFATIASTGTGANAGKISITGSIPEGASGNALYFSSGGSNLITSIDGDIALLADGKGLSGLVSSTSAAFQIESTGVGSDAANIVIETIGAAGGYIWLPAASRIATVDGNVALIGTRSIAVSGSVSSTGTGVHAGEISIVDSKSVYIDGNVNSVDGDISIFSIKQDVERSTGRVKLTGQIISTGVGLDAATITIEGTTDELNLNGVELHGEVISTDGDILISGTGNGRYRSGVEVNYGGFVKSLGSDKDFAATITINGSGGIAGGTGVTLSGGTLESPSLSTVAGDVHIIGQGGNGPENANRGVWIRTSYIQSIGETSSAAGNIKIEGTGGIGGTFDLAGVELDSTSNLVSIAGDIEIIATAGVGTGINNVGLLLKGDSVIGDANTTGDIIIRTDSIDLQSGTIQSTGTLTIAPKLAGTTIGIGGGAGDLNLDDAELTLLADGFESITIGGITAGLIDIDTATFTDDVILSGATINDHAGADIDAGSNTVSLVGTVAPGQSPGILSLTGDIKLADASVLDLEINGPAAGETATDHDQVSVVGTLTIGSGVELRLTTTNGFDPLLGQQLVIVDNDGTDPIDGVFAGLPEGTILTDFLGATVDARISYLGLDEATGNDVVLTIIKGNLAPSADAGGPYAIEEGDSLTLDGSGSSDPDEDILIYTWDLNGDGDFSDAEGKVPNVTWAKLVTLGIGNVAQFDVALSVDDGRANPVIDSATVNVLLNSPPTADAGGPYFIDEGGSVTLDARGTVDDKGIENLIIEWDLDGDGLFGETGVDAERGDETGLQPVFSAALVDGPQVIPVQLRVTDARGKVDVDSATISVRNVAPTLQLPSTITIGRGDALTVAGSFVDPGPDDWTVTVNYADGSDVQVLTLNDKAFQLDHVYSTAGIYTAVVTIDDGDGGVTSKSLTVDVELPPLPDLKLISADVSFLPINPPVGNPVNFVVGVTNAGTLAASNVVVSVQVYDAASDAYLEIGRPAIELLLGDGAKGNVSLTWDGTTPGQPALPSEDAYLLVRVVVDPALTIEELDESNNEAIQVLQVGSPNFGSAGLVADVSPFTANQGVRVTVGGQAFYDFSSIPGPYDFPVQNASVTARLFDSEGEELAVLGGWTASNGNFSHTIRAPEIDGVYSLQFEVIDGTFRRVFVTTLTVAGVAPNVPPRSSGPAGPGYVFSSSIQFSDPPPEHENHQIGETLSIFGIFNYELSDPLSVPYTFNDLFPVAGQLRTFGIGSDFVSFPDGGLAGPVEVQMDWTPTAEGFHIIQVVAAPEFKSNFKAHTRTTRPILIGDLDTTSLTIGYGTTIVPRTPPAFAPLMSASEGEYTTNSKTFSAPMGLFAMPPSEAPAPGDTLSFTLRYENTGTTTITGGMLIDNFDDTLMGTPTNISHDGVVDGNIVRWVLPDILPGASGTVSYQVTINSSADFPPGSALLFNTAILNADQAVAASTSELTVSNNAPVITGLNVNQVLDANGNVTLSGTFSDASVGDIHAIDIAWGDDQTDTLLFTAGQRSFSIDHSYGADHAPKLTSYKVSISVTDQTNQHDSASVITQVPEDQIVPLAVADSYSVNQAETLSVGIDDNVLLNDTPATGDPLQAFLVTGPAHSSSFALNADGTFTYTPLADFRGTDQFVYVAQSNGKPSGETIVEIDVRNLAPTISSANIAGAGEQAVAGETLSLDGTFVDAGTSLVHTGTVDWGDGSVPQSLTVAFGSGSGSFTATHVYAIPGTFTATVTISDGELDTTVSIQTTVIEAVDNEPGVTVHQGQLRIVGTDANDIVTVSRRGSQVYITASFLPAAHWWRMGSISFPLADVQSVHADMGAGNDVFSMSAWLVLPTIIDGGDGNDVLYAGGGPSIVLGGAGNDLLFGGRDRSILVGGTGRDRLIGGRDDDVLIGGEIQAIDGSLSGKALHDQIMATWNSDDSYTDRTDALTALVDDVDDDERDLLFGLSGRDLYFDGLGDRLLGVRSSGSEVERKR